MNALIVDDDATNRKLLHVTLEAEGHSVFEAADGVQALEVLARESIGIVISDILMPNMDGYRLCYEVRRSDKLKLLPFIIYTSTYNSPADEKLARDLGADEFIKKPANTATILDALYELTHEAKYDQLRKVKRPPKLELMKEYSQRLVAKLEEKNVELGETKETLRQANQELEQRVRERTAQLEAANKELEAFSYSISHDLRAPLRAMGGFAQILEQEFTSQLSPGARKAVQRIRDNAAKMSQLIDGLLDFSSLNWMPMTQRAVAPALIAREVFQELHPERANRRVEIEISELPACHADAKLLKHVFVNLLSNALKYSRGRDPAVIKVGWRPPGESKNAGTTAKSERSFPRDEPREIDASGAASGLPGNISRGQENKKGAYFVQDNGAGFDMEYAGKLFQVFQRLHSAEQFEGTGVGLAIVQRIIQRHGGRVWAEGHVDRGATFYFTLGDSHHENSRSDSDCGKGARTQVQFKARRLTT